MLGNFRSTNYNPSIERLYEAATAGSNYTVQGQQASQEEYFVGLALDRLKLDYYFQWDVLGGRQFRGFVLDFLVITRPHYTPLWVDGRYWHSGSQKSEDRRQEMILRQVYGNDFLPAVRIYDDELKTVEEAYSVVRRKLNR